MATVSHLTALAEEEEASGSVSPSKPRRARKLLAAYYNVDTGTQHSPPKQLSAPNYYSLNSSDLNPDLYVNKLLNEQELVTLIQHDNILIDNIKKLDGDMKTLVYENYSKFISATDTIRSMKSSVEHMEMEMTKLSGFMDSISKSSTSINDALAIKRENIHRLNGITNLRKKLNFIFDLPSKLSTCVKNQQYADAVRFYMKTSHWFPRYRDIPAFQQIEDDCLLIMKDVSFRLKAKMQREDATVTQIAECLGLLIGINIQSINELQLLFLKIMKNKLSISTSKKFSENPSASTEQQITDQINFMNENYLVVLSQFVAVFDTHFLDNSSPVSDEVEQGFKSIIHEVEELYFNQTRKYIKETSVHPYTILDHTFATTLEFDTLKAHGKFFTVLKSLILETQQQFISKVFQDTQLELCDVITSETELEPNESILKFSEWILNRITQTACPQLSTLISPEISFNKYSPTLISNAVSTIKQGLQNFWMTIPTTLLVINQIQNGDGQLMLKISKLCVHLATETIEKSFLVVIDFINASSTPVASSSPSMKMRDKANINSPVFRGGGLGVKSGQGRNKKVEIDDPEFAEMARECVENCKLGGQTILTKYIGLTGNEMTKKIQLAISSVDWLEAFETPSQSASAVWDEVLQQLRDLAEFIGKVYEDDGLLDKKDNISETSRRRYPVSAPMNLQHSRTNSNAFPYMQTAAVTGSTTSFASRRESIGTGIGSITGNERSGGSQTNKYDVLMSTIDKLFEERIEFYASTVELSRSHVLSSLAKIVVKCYLEEVRLLTLGKYGFQQVQVDVEVLRLGLSAYVMDEKQLNTLLEEIISSAFRRCIEPVSIDTIQLEQVLLKYDTRPTNEEVVKNPYGRRK